MGNNRPLHQSQFRIQVWALTWRGLLAAGICIFAASAHPEEKPSKDGGQQGDTTVCELPAFKFERLPSDPSGFTLLEVEDPPLNLELLCPPTQSDTTTTGGPPQGILNKPTELRFSLPAHTGIGIVHLRVAYEKQERIQFQLRAAPHRWTMTVKPELVTLAGPAINQQAEFHLVLPRSADIKTIKLQFARGPHTVVNPTLAAAGTAMAPRSHLALTKWTQWLNRDTPGGSGDYETLREFVAAGQVCSQPRAVECLSRDGKSPKQLGQVITCSVQLGAICVNGHQPKGQRCADYRVRFLCPIVEGAANQ